MSHIANGTVVDVVSVVIVASVVTAVPIVQSGLVLLTLPTPLDTRVGRDGGSRRSLPAASLKRAGLSPHPSRRSSLAPGKDPSPKRRVLSIQPPTC